MKYVIRKDVFETNSSSVHTITYANILEPSNLPTQDGFTLAKFGSFGKDYAYYFSQSDKLSYMVTFLYLLINGYYDEEEFEYDVDEFYNDNRFKILEGIIKEHCGTKGLIICKGKESPYIDHQSAPNGGWAIFKNSDFYNKDFLKNFIFNPMVLIHTDCD